MTAAEDLQEARRKLHEYLSGRAVPKQNAAPTPSNGYEEFAAQIQLNAAQRQKLNSSKRELVEMLSHGTIHGGFDDGTEIVAISQDLVQKQAAARRELHDRLAGTYRKGQQKQNQCPRDNSRGKTDVTLDSPITPSGVPFVGKYGYITGRGGKVTLESILRDEMESADEDSPSPAVTSGQDGTSDWSPRDHQDVEYDGGDEEFDPEAESSAILQMYAGVDGTIRKHAKKYFLNVNGDGTDASHYAVPLARINKVSMQPDYDSDAINEAFAIAAGRDSGLANYGAMSRLVRLKQRENMPLNDAQRDHSIRHMASMYTAAPTRAEKDAAILKTMRR